MATPLPQMLTAALLRTGDVVYWQAGQWVLRLNEGEVFADPAAADAALAAAQAGLTRNEYIEPYLFEVRVENGNIRPVKEKEIIRAAGPSVHPNLGKQAEHV